MREGGKKTFKRKKTLKLFPLKVKKKKIGQISAKVVKGDEIK